MSNLFFILRLKYFIIYSFIKFPSIDFVTWKKCNVTHWNVLASEDTREFRHVLLFSLFFVWISEFCYIKLYGRVSLTQTKNANHFLSHSICLKTKKKKQKNLTKWFIQRQTWRRRRDDRHNRAVNSKWCAARKTPENDFLCHKFRLILFLLFRKPNRAQSLRFVLFVSIFR